MEQRCKAHFFVKYVFCALLAFSSLKMLVKTPLVSSRVVEVVLVLRTRKQSLLTKKAQLAFDGLHICNIAVVPEVGVREQVKLRNAK